MTLELVPENPAAAYMVGFSLGLLTDAEEARRRYEEKLPERSPARDDPDRALESDG